MIRYPAFRQLHAAAKDQAELMAISVPLRIDVTFGSDQETERVWRQFVSGSMFPDFALKPALENCSLPAMMPHPERIPTL